MTGLDVNQQRAATLPLGPLVVIAGPGSGKTRTMAARVEHLSASMDSSKMLILTHTTKAAGEIRDRLEAGPGAAATCTTIHAAAWRQVRSEWAAWGHAGSPQLAPSSWALVRDAAVSVLGRTAVTNEKVSDLASEIEWARAWLIDVGGYAAASVRYGRSCEVEAAKVDEIWEMFSDLKLRAGVVDFGDVLEIASAMLSDEGIANRVRASRQALFVDEYQDVDRAQQRLIDAWLGGSDAITVTGDAEQAIFGFKGGDPSLLFGFADRYPGAAVVHLVDNYRSTPEIVAWVNKLTLMKRPSLIGHGEGGTSPKIADSATEADEEKALVEQLRSWRRNGIDWSEMAVLYRFNAAAARLEAALSQAGVPYHVAGNAKFFDRPEVRAVLVPFGKAARRDPDANGVAALEDAAAGTGWHIDKAPEGMGAARQRWETIAALMTMVQERHRDDSAGELLVRLQDRARQSHDLTPNGVTLGTAHAAKGLEWDAVWVAGVAEGQFPSAYATTKEQLEEEQHLIYVAVSRARKHLVLSYARKRHNNWRSEPSRFLALLGHAGLSSSSRAKPSRRTTTAGASPVSPRGLSAAAEAVQMAGCERCGAKLTGMAARVARRCSARCLEGEAAARYQRLEMWREAACTELGLVERDVASDRALFSAAAVGYSAGVAGFSGKGGTPPL